MPGQKAALRVVIADQQPNVRQALWLVCEQEPGLNIVAEAANKADLLTLLRTTQPDMVIVEWTMTAGDPSGVLVPSAFHRPLMVIATGTHPEEKQAAMSAGIQDFIFKSDPPEKLLDALHTAIARLGRKTPP